jgi:hypothetical protein
LLQSKNKIYIEVGQTSSDNLDCIGYRAFMYVLEANQGNYTI